MKTPKKAERRRKLTDEELVRIAMTRFGDGEVCDISAVANATTRNPAVVIRAITSAVRRGLVEVHPKAAASRTQRLEAGLVEGFDLLGARVTETPSGIGSSPSEQDDLVLQLTGRSLGEALGSPLVLADEASIAIGSGRAMHHAAEYLREHGSLRVRGVKIFSLSGNLLPESQVSLRNIRFDADWNAGILGQAFLHHVELNLMSHLLVAKTPEKAEEALSERWPGKTSSFGRSLTHVCCGVGMFENGHRLFDAAESESMSPIRDLLIGLRNASVEIRLGFPKQYTGSPVCDVSNRLLVVRPLGIVNPPDLVERLKDLKAKVAEINNYFIQARALLLRPVMVLCVAAGTPRKAQAILHLLHGDSACQMGYLCTDRETGEWLLQHKGEMQYDQS